MKRVRPDYSHILTGRMVGTNDQWELTVTFSRSDRPEPLWTERAAGSIDDLPRIEMLVVERVADTSVCRSISRPVSRSGSC